MQKRIGVLVLACLAVGVILAAGCKREEPREDGNAVPQSETMPMERDTGSGMDAMQEMDHDMEGMDHNMEEGDRGMMAKTTENGAALFQQHCALCHPGGSNIITPDKTLDRKTLEKNGIATVEDIVALTRTPGPGMTPFGPELLSDKEAKQVAEHILSTY
jgi:cytochrome c6